MPIRERPLYPAPRQNRKYAWRDQQLSNERPLTGACRTNEQFEDCWEPVQSVAPLSRSTESRRSWTVVINSSFATDDRRNLKAGSRHEVRAAGTRPVRRAALSHQCVRCGRLPACQDRFRRPSAECGGRCTVGETDSQPRHVRCARPGDVRPCPAAGSSVSAEECSQSPSACSTLCVVLVQSQQ